MIAIDAISDIRNKQGPGTAAPRASDRAEVHPPDH